MHDAETGDFDLLNIERLGGMGRQLQCEVQRRAHLLGDRALVVHLKAHACDRSEQLHNTKTRHSYFRLPS